MAKPKKTKALRTLVVDDKRIRWRISINALRTAVVLQGDLLNGQQAVITIHDWDDPWDTTGEVRLLPNDPEAITAKFVRDSARFALENGWLPEQAGQPMLIDYRGGAYSLPQPAEKP
jgi:hypothetical protein